jgi:hypothetical protein
LLGGMTYVISPFSFDIKKTKIEGEKRNLPIKKIKVFASVLFYNKDSVL